MFAGVVVSVGVMVVCLTDANVDDTVFGDGCVNHVTDVVTVVNMRVIVDMGLTDLDVCNVVNTVL